MFISTMSAIAKANRALCFSNAVSSWKNNKYSRAWMDHDFNSLTNWRIIIIKFIQPPFLKHHTHTHHLWNQFSIGQPQYYKSAGNMNQQRRFGATSPLSLPSVPSKSKASVKGSIPVHLAIQMPLVVWCLKHNQHVQLNNYSTCSIKQLLNCPFQNLKNLK